MGKRKLGKVMKTALKTATYRAIAAGETFALAWLLTGHVGAAGAIAGLAEGFKTLVYVGHEAAWAWATEEE